MASGVTATSEMEGADEREDDLVEVGRALQALAEGLRNQVRLVKNVQTSRRDHNYLLARRIYCRPWLRKSPRASMLGGKKTCRGFAAG